MCSHEVDERVASELLLRRSGELPGDCCFRDDRECLDRLDVAPLDERLAGLPAGEVATRVGIPLSTCSKHLRVLRAAGLVELDSQGTWRFYRAMRPAIKAVSQALLDLIDETTKGNDCAKPDRTLRHQRS